MGGMLQDATVLLVGAGGLGCPAALVLHRAGVGRLLIADDDRVELGNLHRQILFTPNDLGEDKLDAAARGLRRATPESRTVIELVRSRFLPENARELVRRVDLVIEGADNFATKFLAADACRLEGRPIVHGAAIRWRATVWSVRAEGRPCYRCVFEDLPDGEAAPNCATAGVMGPVTGIAGALMADLALRFLSDASASGLGAGVIHSYDGLEDRFRRIPISPRVDCPLCGLTPKITQVDEARYLGPPCVR